MPTFFAILVVMHQDTNCDHKRLTGNPTNEHYARALTLPAALTMKILKQKSQPDNDIWHNILPVMMHWHHDAELRKKMQWFKKNKRCTYLPAQESNPQYGLDLKMAPLAFHNLLAPVSLLKFG